MSISRGTITWYTVVISHVLFTFCSRFKVCLQLFSCFFVDFRIDTYCRVPGLGSYSLCPCTLKLEWYSSLEIRRKVVLFELVGITLKISIKMDRPHTYKLLYENHMDFRQQSCVSHTANNLHQWYCMFAHQGWFINYICYLYSYLILYSLKLHSTYNTSYTLNCIVQVTLFSHITFPSEKFLNMEVSH